MKFALLFLVLLSTTQCFASSDSTTTQTKLGTPRPVATIKFNPTCIINPFRQSLYFSSDIWLYKNYALELGAGWIFNGVEANYRGEYYRGFRGRLGVKYVFNVGRYFHPAIGLEGKYNFIQRNKLEELLRYGGQYTEIMGVNSTVHTGGVAVKSSFAFFVGKQKNVLVESYIGFGYKYTAVKRTLPEDAADINRIRFATVFIEPTEGTHHLFDMLLGVNIGYVFSKRK